MKYRLGAHRADLSVIKRWIVIDTALIIIVPYTAVKIIEQIIYWNMK